MGFGGHVKASPVIRPALNLGCLMDVPNGRCEIGEHGESILDAGLNLVTGAGGRGNTFKSTLAHFMNLRAVSRYSKSFSSIWDSEPPSVSRRRITKLQEKMDEIRGVDLFESNRLVLSDSTVMLGDEWFESTKVAGEEKVSKENLKDNLGTTPFISKDGKNIKMLFPWIAECDSLSMMPMTSVEAIYEKNDVGQSGMNVEALRSSHGKSQILMQMTTVPGKYGIYYIFTAHVGDDLALDPYAPPAKKLSFLKNKVKFKNVPEKFTFITNNLWYCLSASVFKNDTTKGPQYPRAGEENMVGDTDLQIVEIQNLRGKAGPSGMPFQLVISQAEGVLPSLSEFHYLKTFGGYGLGGNDRSYFLDLVPDVPLQRTTVRSKIDENPTLRRALEITSEMLQMGMFWHDLDESIKCTPAQLYSDLKAKGYDWDILLNHTRGYWIFKEEEAANPKKFLSTMDLLRMRAGLYHPYWYDDYLTSLGKTNTVVKASPKE